MSSPLLPRALLVLGGNYFRSVPGFPYPLVVGLACWIVAASGMAPVPGALAAAGGVFVIAVPALFAGSQFRLLDRGRTHALLPGFREHLLLSSLLHFALLGLAAGALAFVANGLPFAAASALAFLALSFLFWFGFFPAAARFALGAVLVASALGAEGGGMIAARGIAATASATLAIALVGWGLFAAWRLRRGLPEALAADEARGPWNLPLALRAPWPEGVGSPAGTLLLGIDDGPAMRAARAFLGVVAIPAALLGALAWLGGVASDRVLGSPALAFLALMYAFAFFSHLCGTAASRRRLLWLRGDRDWPALARLCEAVLGRELAALAVALGASLGALVAAGVTVAPTLALFALAWLAGLAVQLHLALQPGLPAGARSALVLVHLLGLAAAAAASHVTREGEVLAIAALLQLILAAALRWRAFAGSRRGGAEA